MEASELRCGNKLVRQNGNIATVTWGVIKDIENGDKTYQPIPLNEEWLIKLGAKRNQIPNGFWISVTNLKAELHFETFANTSEIVTTLISQSCELILDRIYYIHQLQNLYYALTGQELTEKQK